MKRIDVRAERDYSVLVDAPYLQALAPHFKKRERVAVIFSESMKASIPQIDAQDSKFSTSASQIRKKAKVLKHYLRSGIGWVQQDLPALI